MITKNNSFNFIQTAITLYNNRLQTVSKGFFIIEEGKKYNYLVKEKTKDTSKIKSIIIK